MKCPTCEHEMEVIHVHRCPRCGTIVSCGNVDVPLIVERAAKYWGRTKVYRKLHLKPDDALAECLPKGGEEKTQNQESFDQYGQSY